VRYREHAPAPALRRAVACYWTLRGAAAATDAAGERAHRVLPDGSLDILFDVAAGDAAVIGVMTRAIVSDAAGAVDLVGVRFHPGEAASYLGVAARDTRDRALGLRDVCGAWGREIAERLAEAAPRDRAAVLDDALLARRRRQPPDARVRAALAALGCGAALGPVARDVAVSDRQLERLFDDHVGIGPKLFARVLRVQRVVAAIDAAAPGVRVRWAELAAALGYADQAHLIREVRALTGVTPAALARERSAGVLGVSELSNPPAAALDTVGA
jgi:AraC-like DNA-binding protein